MNRKHKGETRQQATTFCDYKHRIVGGTTEQLPLTFIFTSVYVARLLVSGWVSCCVEYITFMSQIYYLYFWSVLICFVRVELRIFVSMFYDIVNFKWILLHNHVVEWTILSDTVWNTDIINTWTERIFILRLQVKCVCNNELLTERFNRQLS